jgi:hypothetical protein
MATREVPSAEHDVTVSQSFPSFTAVVRAQRFAPVTVIVRQSVSTFTLWMQASKGSRTRSGQV